MTLNKTETEEDVKAIDQEEKKALIALNMVPGIGGKRVRQILQDFDSAADFLDAGPSAWRTVHGIGEALSTQLSHLLDEGEHEQELKKADEQEIDLITFRSPEFPSLLKQVHDHPVLLSVRGSTPIDQTRTLAIVGTRGCTYYGRKQAKRFATMLSYRGFTVVSGLARGIDSHAHEGAVQASGKTIAVFGNGLGHVYPKENEELADEVAENGALVSELPIDTPPEGRNFPRRNRIISGLSLGVLVVEAPGRSGALITTDLALEQNREVFAIPGNIDSPESEGCNRLIQQGAIPVMDIEDILEHLPSYVLEEEGESQYAEDPSSDQEVSFKNKQEEIVYNALTNEPVSIEALTDELDMKPSELSSILTQFEVKGIVEQLPGKRFVKK